MPFSQLSSTFIVPKGTWHTAKVPSSCKIPFITPGEGTLNCDDPRSRNA